MHIQVDLAEQEGVSVDPVLIDDVIRETLLRSGCNFSSRKEIGLSVAFVSPEEIRRFNQAYRQKDKVTDVLSFPEYVSKEAIEGADQETLFLGELILCYDYIRQAAEEDQVSFRQELAYILSHGVLHLLGFDHSPEMFALQDQVSEPYGKTY